MSDLCAHRAAAYGPLTRQLRTEDHGIMENGGEGADELQREVRGEIAFEERLLRLLKAPRRWGLLAHAIVVVLIAMMIVAMLEQPYVFLVWLFVGFLVYSYNFIIFLIPTTTTRIRPGERGETKNMDKQARWLAIRLLLKNKQLAVEIGLTVFLGGMIPLAWSFAVIFGITALFTIYYGFIVGFITYRTTITVLAQITFVFLLYILIYLLEPRTQGITKLTALDNGVKAGSSALRSVATAILAVAVLLGLLTSLLGFWALLLPAVTVPALLEAYELLNRFDLILFILVLAAQLLVMRHIQSYASRRRAVDILALRIRALKGIEDQLTALPRKDEGTMALLRMRFHSLAIYDIVEHDIYGALPVYLAGPRPRYLLDAGVMAELK